MAYSLGSLTAYVEQNADELVASAVLSAKTAGLIKSQGNVMVGVKSAQTINIMDTDAIFQSGGSCGFTPSGSTSFTQRQVSVGKIKINESLCPKNFEQYYLQKALTTGSTYDSVAFAKEYTDRKIAKIAAQMEIALWQGDTTSVNVNLNKFDGLQKLITGAGGSVINANSSTYYGTPATDITATNVTDVFDALYKALPAEIVDLDDTAILCGTDVFRTYALKLRSSNLFAYTLDQKTDVDFVLPGTTIKVIPVHGLNGTKDLYAFRWSNIYMATDLMNEEEKFELYYSKDNDEVRFISEFKAGVNFAFPDQIVKFIV